MANGHSITDFISNFGGGSRTNRFRITSAVSDQENSYGFFDEYHVRATTLPSAKIGVIPVSYRGRVVNYPGDRTYDPWSVVVLDDPNAGGVAGGSLYEAFHAWHNAINSHEENVSNPDAKQNFCNNLVVEQIDLNGSNVIRKFELLNAWPVEVGPVQLDIGQMDTLVTFQVTLVYSHYKAL